MHIIIFLAVGAISGWLAGKLMSGNGFGLIGDIVVGIVGGYVGSYVLSLFGISWNGSGVIGGVATAVIGACLLIYIVRLVKKD